MTGYTATQDTVIEDELAPVALREVSPTRLAWRQFLKHRLAVVSFVVLGIMLLAAIQPTRAVMALRRHRRQLSPALPVPATA